MRPRRASSRSISLRTNATRLRNSLLLVMLATSSVAIAQAASDSRPSNPESGWSFQEVGAFLGCIAFAWNLIGTVVEQWRLRMPVIGSADVRFGDVEIQEVGIRDVLLWLRNTTRRRLSIEDVFVIIEDETTSTTVWRDQQFREVRRRNFIGSMNSRLYGTDPSSKEILVPWLRLPLMIEPSESIVVVVKPKQDKVSRNATWRIEIAVEPVRRRIPLPIRFLDREERLISQTMSERTK